MLCGEVFVWAPDDTEAGACFGRRISWNIIFRERHKRSVTSNVFQSIDISLQPGYFQEAGNVRRLAVMKVAGVNGCQGTPLSEELDGKELHGVDGGEHDREPRQFALFCTRSQHNLSRHLRCGIMLVLTGVVLLHDPLYSCSILEEYLTSSFVFYVANCASVHTDKSSDLRKKAASLNSRIASLYVASARSRRVVAENSRITLVVLQRA